MKKINKQYLQEYLKSNNLNYVSFELKNLTKLVEFD